MTALFIRTSKKNEASTANVRVWLTTSEKEKEKITKCACLLQRCKKKKKRKSVCVEGGRGEVDIASYFIRYLFQTHRLKRRAVWPEFMEIRSIHTSSANQSCPWLVSSLWRRLFVFLSSYRFFFDFILRSCIICLFFLPIPPTFFDFALMYA